MNDYSITGNKVIARNLDIRHTVQSGQPLTFYAAYDWEKNSISYIDGQGMLSAKFSSPSKGKTIIKFSGAANSASMKEFVKRFRLNESLGKVYKEINTDKFMADAISQYNGMRLTINDPWETTLCFILSQYNNLGKIRRSMLQLIDEFGTEDGRRMFPKSEDLLGASEADLKKCGVGFRAKYIMHAAEYCTNNLDLNSIGKKDYYSLKETLMEISGVGDKVADCIALMGYGKMEAFPIDVWVKRTLERVYFKGKEKRINELHIFTDRKWEKYRGYAQQYLFHYGRNNNL